MASQTDVPAVVGLLCGGGLLPVRVAESLRARGVRVVAAAIKGDAAPEVEGAVDECHWTGLARLGGWVRLFKDAGAGGVLMVGSIRKARMFESIPSLLPDLRSLRMWGGRLASKQDHTILEAVAAEFEKEGLPVRAVPEFCPDLLIPQGPLTRRRPSAEQWRDIQFAWPIIKQIAALQVGQTIVVKDEAVVAVEAMEGTDPTLRRGGELADGAAVAVKVAKEDHDLRFDIPCVGPDTVAVLQEAGIACLAIEAGWTILLDGDQVRAAADRAGLCIVAVTDEQVASASGGASPCA